MKKVAMNKVRKDVLLEMLQGENLQVVIPSVVRVVDYQNGYFTNKDGEEIPYASLKVVDLEELEKLQSVGLEENTNEIKVKLRGYSGEQLESLLGVDVLTTNFDLQFNEKNTKYGSIIEGLIFSAEISSLQFKK